MLRGETLGFDLEWQPTFVKGGTRNPVALVQLADANVMLLIQVSAMRGNHIIVYYAVWSESMYYRVPRAPQIRFRKSTYHQNRCSDPR